MKHEKLAIVLLSINAEVLCRRFIQSYIDTSIKNIPAIVFAQGFSENDVSRVHELIDKNNLDKISIIYDDNVYQKGLSISEIRDYFYHDEKYQSLISEYEYILVTDDDHYYYEECYDKINDSVEFMIAHPKAGL